VTAIDREPTGSDDRLEQLADEFAARLRAGQRPSVTDYVAANPALAAELRELLPSVAALEELKVRQLASTGRIGFLGLPQDHLGEFRIVREIGRGGMGIVYEAEQESLGRRVALKTLPYAAFLSPQQIERFHREAATAAQLQHPNIVPIHAVGDDAGVHYFAMRRIDGCSLDRAIAAARTGTAGEADPLVEAARVWLHPEAPAERWRRLAAVGAAVADALDFAHRHGVLHRDVKPSNVLIEPDGKVWVTDFGIAKIGGDDGMTRTGEFLGTLQYAPPEHLDGMCDARGDVYGLGLCLFELAAGRPAFASNSRRELADRIRNGVPRALRRLDGSIPRDLDTIVSKATAFDPAHRYASAALLAADLRRFGAGLPIAARDASRVERLWRWGRRNPVTAGFAASTVAAAVAAAALGWYGYLSTREALGREQQATGRAESNLALSLRSLNQLFDAIAEAPPNGGSEQALLDMPSSPSLSRKELDLLRRTVAFYEEFAAHNAADAGLRLDTARALQRIGDLHHWTGALDDADAAYRRAAGYYDQVPGADDADLVVEIAVLERRLGNVALERGQWPAALRAFESVRHTLADEVRDRPGDRNRRELVCTLNTITATLSRSSAPRGRSPAGRILPIGPMLAPAYAQAASCCKQALRIAGELVEAHPDSPTDKLLLARCHRLNAQTLSMAPGNALSAAAIARSMQVLTELSAAEHDRAAYQYELAEANCLMGAVAADAREGLPRCRVGVQQARELAAADPNAPTYQDLLARGLRRLGDTLQRAGATTEAMGSYGESVQLRRELARRFPASPQHALELANVYRSLAQVERGLGQAAQARTELEAAIAVIDGFGQGSDRMLLTIMVLPELQQDLLEVLEALGDDAAAAALRTEQARRQPTPFDAAFRRRR